ncbi:MAG: anti-sigma factor [Actinomycetota bacterium]|nr:anti-sigma factor [Actinomycetota bacterium]
MSDLTQIHALSGAYAVDALDDIERQMFGRHLADCAECRAEVESLREASSRLAEIEAVTPPAHLRASVLSSIAKVRPLPPVAPVVASGRRRLAARLVAAAAALIIILGGVAWHPWTQSAHVTMAERVVHAPDAKSQRVALAQGGSLTVVDSRSLGRATLVMSAVADPPRGKVYEMWLRRPDGSMAPAGLVSHGGNQTLVFAGNSNQATGAAVTVEPPGGSSQPTSAPLALVGLGSNA